MNPKEFVHKAVYSTTVHSRSLPLKYYLSKQCHSKFITLLDWYLRASFADSINIYNLYIYLNVVSKDTS